LSRGIRSFSCVCRASKTFRMFSAERHISRVSTRFCDQSRAWHRIVPHIVLVSFRAGQHRQRQVHIHTRFTFTHASHSHTLHIHTLHIHTRFTFTHASHHTRFTSHTLHIHTRFAFTHTHTRDSLFDSCRILCLSVWLRATPVASSSHSRTHTHVWRRATPVASSSHSHTHTHVWRRATPAASGSHSRTLHIHGLRTHTHWQKASGAALVICCNGRIPQATPPLVVL
jgi:hypothetical protein